MIIEKRYSSVSEALYLQKSNRSEIVLNGLVRMLTQWGTNLSWFGPL